MIQFKAMDYDEYSIMLQEKCNLEYDIASQARSKGHDPKNFVEIPQAHDLADRTQKLLKFLHPRNTAEQIREITIIHKDNRELVAIDIARIVSAESYLHGTPKKCNECKGKGYIKSGWKENVCITCEGAGIEIIYSEMPSWKDTLKEFENIKEFNDEKKIAISIYHGVCAGLAVLTEGILVAPLEGIVSAKLLTNSNGTKCVAISFAGPIRSAGGTGQALSVLIGDILRRMFKLSKSVITNREIERYKEEVSAYARSLQYRPSNPQIEIIAKNCPIYLDGEGVGNEVSGQRDLPRVETNKVREGSILVMCEGLVLKAPKIMKYVKELKLDGWEWINEFISSNDEDNKEVKPCDKFMRDVLAGRPIFGFPMKEGSFRLRYGRSRLGGLAATSVHPATMKALSGFIIVGTQMKYERPGKATVTTPCDSIDGPYIQFKDGSGKRIKSIDELPEGLPIDLDWPIKKIWDLGEILIPVGEFLENNHVLIPSPYVKEWHERVLEEHSIEFAKTFLEAVKQSKEYGISIDPRFVAHFSDISAIELFDMVNDSKISICEGTIIIPSKYTEIIYRLNIDIDKDGRIYGDTTQVLIHNLSKMKKATRINLDAYENSLEWLNSISDYEIRNPISIRIGARMGKPEGAKLREMKPAIHVLFPLGHDVGPQRKVTDSIKKSCKIEIGVRHCNICDKETLQGVCCNENTEFIDFKYGKLELQNLWNEAKLKSGMFSNLPIKGVKGMTSSEKCPENLLKGIYRYKNDISVFRDGTIRYDMVDITMTHFKPSEIGLTLEKSKALGYEVNEIEEVIELYPQDFIAAKQCAEKLLNTTKYLDSILVNLYGLEPYYNCESIEDLQGQLFMSLAPHTSGAILSRLIGFADVKGQYCHPFLIAARRRNSDGDIDSIMLLMDGLINFSKAFLSTHRGGQMDAPLILTTQINPSEIDKEALNVDIGWNYPKEFYELTQTYPNAKEALKVGVKIVETVIRTKNENRGFGYTHESNDCSEGPKNNPYNTLDSMRQKTMVQFALGTTLHSVDNVEQSSRLIDRHLIRDMRGNLRAFGQQKVRCTKCGKSYRRIPISGLCNNIVETKKDPFTGEGIEVICPGNIILTVTKGGISKYKGLMSELVNRYGCDAYTEQLYRLATEWVDESFRDGEEKSQQTLW